MKRVPFFAIPVYLLIASCSGDKDKPDAYGTFEATEVTVSSQSNGKILFLNVEEGQVLDSNVVVGIIDTLDLDLRKSQAREQQLLLRFLNLSPRAAEYYQQLESRDLSARHHARQILALG